MRIYVDRGLQRIIASQGNTSALARFSIKRSPLSVIEVVFLDDGIAVELPNDATGRIEFKDTGKYDEDPLTGAAAWVKFGSGSDTYYQFSVAFINTELDDRFNVDSDEENDVAQLTLMSEVSWRYGTRDYKSQTVTALIDNDVNRDDDVIPDSPAVIYARDSFIRVEDTPPDDEVGVDGDCWIYTLTGDLFQREGGVYVFEMNILGAGGTGAVSAIMVDTADPDDPKVMFGSDLEIMTYA